MDSADLELVLVRLASGGMAADNAAFNIDLHIHRIIRGLACACGKTAINVPLHLALPERDLVVLDGAVIAGITDIATVEIPDAVFAPAFKQQPVVQGAALCTLGLTAVSGKDAACLHALDLKVVFLRRLAEAGNAADNLIERLRAVIGDLTVLKAVHIKEQRTRHIAVPLGVKRRLVFFGEVRPGMSGRAREMEILCRTLQKRQRVRALQRFELLIVNRGRDIIPLDAGVLPAGVHRNRIRDLVESSGFHEFQQCFAVFNAVVETEIELVDIADFADFADFRIDIERISRDLFIAAVINKAVVLCAALLRRHTVARSPNGQAFEIGVEIARLVAKVDDVVVRLARRAPGIAADKPVIRVHPAARHGDLVSRHIPRHGSVPAAAADNGSIRLEFSSFDKDLVPLRTAAGSHSKAAMNRADLAAPDGRRISLGRAVRDKGRAADDICDLTGDFPLHRHFVFFGILRRIIGGRSRRPCRLAAVDGFQPARRRAGHFQLIVRRRAPEIGYAAVYFAVRRRGGAVILLLGVAEAVVVQQHFLRRAGSRIGVQGKLIVAAIPRRRMIHRAGIAREIHHARALQERQLAFGLIRGKRRGVDLDLRPVHSASQTVIIRERQHGGAHADLVAQMEVDRIEIAQRLDVNILRLDIQCVARDVACIAAAVERHAREIRACRERRGRTVAEVHGVARRLARARRVARVDIARSLASRNRNGVVRSIAARAVSPVEIACDFRACKRDGIARHRSSAVAAISRCGLAALQNETVLRHSAGGGRIQTAVSRCRQFAARHGEGIVRDGVADGRAPAPCRHMRRICGRILRRFIVLELIAFQENALRPCQMRIRIYGKLKIPVRLPPHAERIRRAHAELREVQPGFVMEKRQAVRLIALALRGNDRPQLDLCPIQPRRCTAVIECKQRIARLHRIVEVEYDVLKIFDIARRHRALDVQRVVRRQILAAAVNRTCDACTRGDGVRSVTEVDRIACRQASACCITRIDISRNRAARDRDGIPRRARARGIVDVTAVDILQ